MGFFHRIWYSSVGDIPYSVGERVCSKMKYGIQNPQNIVFYLRTHPLSTPSFLIWYMHARLHAPSYINQPPSLSEKCLHICIHPYSIHPYTPTNHPAYLRNACTLVDSLTNQPTTLLIWCLHVHLHTPSYTNQQLSSLIWYMHSHLYTPSHTTSQPPHSKCNRLSMHLKYLYVIYTHLIYMRLYLYTHIHADMYTYKSPPAHTLRLEVCMHMYVYLHLLPSSPVSSAGICASDTYAFTFYTYTYMLTCTRMNTYVYIRIYTHAQTSHPTLRPLQRWVVPLQSRPLTERLPLAGRARLPAGVVKVMMIHACVLLSGRTQWYVWYHCNKSHHWCHMNKSHHWCHCVLWCDLLICVMWLVHMYRMTHLQREGGGWGRDSQM